MQVKPRNKATLEEVASGISGRHGLFTSWSYMSYRPHYDIPDTWSIMSNFGRRTPITIEIDGDQLKFRSGVFQTPRGITNITVESKRIEEFHETLRGLDIRGPKTAFSSQVRAVRAVFKELARNMRESPDEYLVTNATVVGQR